MEGHVSFLQIMSYSKVIWYIGKGFLGIYKIFGIFAKKIGLWQLPLYNALIKAPSPATNGFSKYTQNLDSETIFKSFGLDGFSRGQDVIPWDLLAEIDFFVLSYSLTLS